MNARDVAMWCVVYSAGLGAVLLAMHQLQPGDPVRAELKRIAAAQQERRRVELELPQAKAAQGRVTSVELGRPEPRGAVKISRPRKPTPAERLAEVEDLAGIAKAFGLTEEQLREHGSQDVPASQAVLDTAALFSAARSIRPYRWTALDALRAGQEPESLPAMLQERLGALWDAELHGMAQDAQDCIRLEYANAKVPYEELPASILIEVDEDGNQVPTCTSALHAELTRRGRAILEQELAR